MVQLRFFSHGQISWICFIDWLEERVPDENLPHVDTSKDIRMIIDRFSGKIKDPNVEFPLDPHLIDTIEQWYGIVQDFCSQWENLRMGQLVDLTNEIRKKENKTDEDLLKLIAVGRLALRLKFHLYLHSTQVLAVEALLAIRTHAIGQVLTGEGKSMINGLGAFVLLMLGKKGASISSAKGLSIRDQKAFVNFLKIFGMKTRHICDHQPSAETFKAQLLYGTTSDFEFAVMREMLHGTVLFEGTFDFVMIDEADFLTVDTALNSARLSYPKEFSNDWVYPLILDFIQTHYKNRLHTDPFPPNALHKLKKFLIEFEKGQHKEQAEKLVDADLNKWLDSGHTALFKREEGQDYVVDLSEQPDGTKKKSILIVDVDKSGRTQHHSRWQAGVQEFLEAKHGIDVEKESLCPISLSHSVFYNKFALKLGFTGTLGGALERETIDELYQFKMFDVPTHFPSIRVDLPDRIFRTTEERRNYSIQRARQMKALGRPMLLICETIKESNTIAKLLKDHGISFELMNEVQEKSEDEIIDNAGFETSLTVATLNAARGTNVKLSKKSVQNGGLLLHFTFHPDSLRTERQVRGRAGRQGEPGESEMALSLEQLELPDVDISTSAAQELLLRNLNQRREGKAGIVKRFYSCRVSVEQYAFGYTELFFSDLNNFRKAAVSESFLDQKSESLGTRKIYKPKPDFTKLPLKDRQIAEQAFTLLTTPGNTKNQWKTLLEGAAKRIQEKVITHWSICFSEQVEDLMNFSRMHEHAVIENYLATSLEQGDGDALLSRHIQLLYQAIVGKSQQRVDAMKAKITKLYDEQKKHWENYLKPEGLIQYIRELTQTSLELV